MAVDDLLELYLKSRKEKSEAISHQKYEKAASARDDERQYSVKLYELLINNKVSDFDYNKFDECIDNYCISEYGFSIKDTDSLKQIIRQRRLKDLGI
jgi:hypothetical protein